MAHQHSTRVKAKELGLSLSATQQKRREQTLEDQKRRRALRVDSNRNLEAFSNLTLGYDSGDSGDDPEVAIQGVGQFASLVQPEVPEEAPSDQGSSHKPRRKKRSNWKYAEKCMYAELLELTRDIGNANTIGDVLPDDLETDWIALAPVPNGKRCLAVTKLVYGSPATVPTFLHSRLKGKTILSFSSPLPPDTILDCILDHNWRANGILHILDVIRWHGQDIADGECSFRLWWRDTRLSELQPLPLPPSASETEYTFSCPTTFLAVPAYSPLSYSSLISLVIPAARTSREVEVIFPSASGPQVDSMETDPVEKKRVVTDTDGLLLYYASASYETGTTPLALWVPHTSEDSSSSPMDILQHLLHQLHPEQTALLTANSTENMEIQ